MDTKHWQNPHITPFDWLVGTKSHRRGGLCTLAASIRRGDYRGPSKAQRRLEIMEMIQGLMKKNPPLTDREHIGLMRLLTTMDRTNQRDSGETNV